MAGVQRTVVNSLVNPDTFSVTRANFIARLPTNAVILATALSGDGKWLVSGETSGNLTIFEVDTGETFKFGLPGGILALDMSHYGSMIALSTTNNVVVYTWTNTNLVTRSPLLESSYGGSYSVKLARDNSSVFYAANHNILRRANLDGEIFTDYSLGNHYINQIAFSHDGHAVVGVDSFKNVRWWDVNNPGTFSDMFVQQLDESGDQARYWPFAISHDLVRFAAFVKNLGVIVWNATRPAEYIRVLPIEDTNKQKPFALNFSQNDQELIITFTGEADFFQRRSLVANIMTREIVANMFNTHDFVFSSDGLRFAYQKGENNVEIYQFK